jgi:hypothetical protein
LEFGEEGLEVVDNVLRSRGVRARGVRFCGRRQRSVKEFSIELFQVCEGVQEKDARVGGLTVFQVCTFPEEMDHGSSRVGGLSGQSDDGGAHSG